MGNRLKKFDLYSQIATEVCRIKEVVIDDESGYLINKYGWGISYDASEYVGFESIPICLKTGNKIVAVELWGDFLLKIYVRDGKADNLVTIRDWGEFTNGDLEKVLKLLKNLI